MTRTRRHFTGDEKLAIVKKHLIDKVPISDLCDEFHLQPTQIYQWQNLLFQNGASVFASKTNRRSESAKDKKIASLQSKLQSKNEVVSELMEEHLQLKKELGDP